MLKGDILLCNQCGRTAGYFSEPRATADRRAERPKRKKPWDMSTEEAARAFQTDESAITWLKQRLWPTGPACPNCAEISTGEDRENPLESKSCGRCGHEYNLLTKTGLETTTLPICVWLKITHEALTEPEDGGWEEETAEPPNRKLQEVVKVARRARRMRKLNRDPLER